MVDFHPFKQVTAIDLFFANHSTDKAVSSTVRAGLMGNGPRFGNGVDCNNAPALFLVPAWTTFGHAWAFGVSFIIEWCLHYWKKGHRHGLAQGRVFAKETVRVFLPPSVECSYRHSQVAG
jgi:hypothetical protein